MRLVVATICCLLVLGCAARKVKRASTRIATTAVTEVSKTESVSFTLQAKQLVFERTDSYVRPRIQELEVSPAAEQRFSSDAKLALGGQVAALKTLSPANRVVTVGDIKWFDVATHDYGGLVLSSSPPGADVFCTSHGNSHEGVTKIARSYPVGTYTFDLLKDKCKKKTVNITIHRNANIQLDVPLECE